MSLLLVLGAVAFPFVGGAGVVALARANEERLLRRRPTPIASVVDGHRVGVKIVGRVRLRQRPVASPKSGAPCVAWRLTVAAGPSVRGLPGADPPGTTEGGVDFYVEYETCRVRVPAGRVTLARAWQRSERGPLVDDPAATSPANYFIEQLVEEGQRVALLGRFEWEPDPDRGSVESDYRTMPLRLAPRGGRRRLLLLSDHPRHL